MIAVETVIVLFNVLEAGQEEPSFNPSDAGKSWLYAELDSSFACSGGLIRPILEWTGNVIHFSIPRLARKFLKRTVVA
jgi:hypothetical protein